ncbi:MAG: S46 family peptidase [Deferribacteres bacterium]|nr:S46 family peptidase [candidate division KSB1 bacterium]MCB9504191.1 S46 family peptidase [Deferribacteres bacterium]
MKKLVWVLSLILFFGFTAFPPDEGMWLLTQLKQLDLNKKGLELKVEDVYHPTKKSLTDAIVWLGGCSASFVSPDGLILTNHHCARGGLQRASAAREGVDYITDGFLAKTREDELQSIDATASVLEEVKDVTADVLDAVKDVKDPLERDKAINAKIREISDGIEGDREDILARIASNYNGKQYMLYVFKRYRDVRIVYAPPSSIGTYGGDIDNWMWPRHTGDFTYLRAYMAPDGSGAEYSPDNVPVKPKNYLRISQGDLDDGDFTFILGYPGSTTRWRTSNSVEWNLKYNYPQSIENFKELINLMDELTKDDPAGKIKVASLNASLNNVMKNYQGKVDGMKKTDFLGQKRAFERDLMAFIDSDKNLKKKYGQTLEKIKEQYEILGKTRLKDDILQMGRFSGTLAGIASQAYGIAKEMDKPESEREPGFDEKMVERTMKRIPTRYLGYFEPVDKAMLKRMLTKANELPSDQRLAGLDKFFKNDYATVGTFVDNAYSTSKMSDPEFAKSLFGKSVKELESMNDPFLQLAAALYDENKELNDRYDIFGPTIDGLRKEYIDALYAWKGTGLYPDANSTIRFTYGNVSGYEPADAVWYKPFTTLSGVVEKNTGEEPFDMPEKLGKLAADKDYGQWVDPDLNDVPVAFTHMCDITGGNSGSAVMNSKGELIGLAFDGNYEAMTGDWQYDYDMQRTISVDIRYVMFITEKFAGATHLIKEMGIKPSETNTGTR